MMIKKELRADGWKYILASIILFLVAVTLIWQFPLMQDIIRSGELEDLPTWIRGEIAEQQEFPVYLAANWFENNLIQIGGILAILLGMSAAAREVEDNTIEFILSRPFSRGRIFFTKTVIQLTVTLIIVSFTTLFLGFIGLIFNYEINFFRLLTAIIPVLLKLFILYSLTLYISLYLDDQIRSGLAAAVMVGVLWGLSLLEPLSFLNLFSYGRVVQFYRGGSFPYLETVFLACVGLILYGLSFNRFRSRDF